MSKKNLKPMINEEELTEAAVRNGENGNTELNLVRSRSGMGNRTATLDNILAERLMELMWEGWRRNFCGPSRRPCTSTKCQR